MCCSSVLNSWVKMQKSKEVVIRVSHRWNISYHQFCVIIMQNWCKLCTVEKAPSHFMEQSCARSNISNTRDNVSSGYQNCEKRVETRHAADYFWWNSRCLASWWNIVWNVWYIFSIESKVKSAYNPIVGTWLSMWTILHIHLCAPIFLLPVGDFFFTFLVTTKINWMRIYTHFF